jgi:Uma2 family endonuclease
VSAEPIEPDDLGRGWPGPDLHRQRLADYTIEDVLKLPDDAPRVELDDGVMFVVPSPALGHQRIHLLLWRWLEQHAPEELVAVTGVGVAVSPTSTFEPDVLLLKAGVANHHYFMPEQVALVVEVVSPGTRTRDRFTKLVAYAAAGIRCYWRIEQDPVHVFAYQMGPEGVYRLAHDSTELLELKEPFEIRLPIAEITP